MATVLNAFDHNQNVSQTIADDIIVKGNGTAGRGSIDGKSTVTLQSTTGSITIESKIDGQCDVALKAAGDIVINGKIDGQCTVRLECGGSITLKGEINGQSTVRFEAANTPPPNTGWIRTADINGQSYVRLVAYAIEIQTVNDGPAGGRTGTTVKYSAFQFSDKKANAHTVVVSVPSDDPYPFG